LNSDKLSEIRNKLYRLPAMEERLSKILNRIADAEMERDSLLVKYEAEAMDVENLQKESLSTTLLRLFGKYDSKLDKEIQEKVQAKLEYDKAVERVKELLKERDELSLSISALRDDQRFYEAELKRREDEIKRNTAGEKSTKYHQLEEDQKNLYKQLVEIDEAIKAANRAKRTALRIQEHLKSADRWATYDVWFKGGIVSHMAKYGHIDDAEAEYNRLASNLRDLEKELSDINVAYIPGLTGVDSTTRAIDFWFDNIFTDLKVRDKIRNDIAQLDSILSSISKIIYRLESNKRNIENRLKDIERDKNNLIMNL